MVALGRGGDGYNGSPSFVDGRLRRGIGWRRLSLDRRATRVSARCRSSALCLASNLRCRSAYSVTFARDARRRPPGTAARGRGSSACIAHSVQAVCEALVVNNLGLDTATTATQAFVIGLVLAAVWVWSRRRLDESESRRLPRINPLEAAGATLVVTSYGMIFAVRGTSPASMAWRTRLVQRHSRIRCRSVRSGLVGRRYSVATAQVDRASEPTGAYCLLSCRRRDVRAPKHRE